MVNLLKSTKLFRGCTDDELAQVAKLCQQEKFKKGTFIFEAGWPADNLYIIKDGVIELRFEVTQYLASRKIALDRKMKGDAFGWSALAAPYSYTLSAYATTDTELLKLEKKDLDELCEQNNHFGLVLMGNIAEIIGERFGLIQKILIDMIQQKLTDKEL